MPAQSRHKIYASIDIRFSIFSVSKLNITISPCLSARAKYLSDYDRLSVIKVPTENTCVSFTPKSTFISIISIL